MKNQSIIYLGVAGLLMFSCAEKETDSYTDAMKEEVVNDAAMADGELQSETPEPLGQHALVDTLGLPAPLMLILSKHPETAPDKIRNVREYTEQGTDYYEITFDNPVEDMQVITYDNLGKIKSPDLPSN